MIITVSGFSGTGTSTICRMLRARLGYAYIDAGSIYRYEAGLLKMSLPEFLVYCDNKPEFHKAVDTKMIEFARTYPNCILEGRISGWILAREGISALKILFTAPLEVCAERVSKRDHLTYEQAYKANLHRNDTDKKRYMDLYEIDVDDHSVYDVIFDTSKYMIEQEVEGIIDML